MNILAIPEATMSSREIAVLTEKQHQHVKRDIESMLIDLKEDVSNFGRIYMDSMNREQTEYALDRELTETLLTGYSAPLRRAVIARWRELENGSVPQFQVPTTLAGALQLAADQAKLIEEQTAALEVAQPKADFVDRYVVASSGSKKFREVCKILKVKENAFWDFLESAKIMYRLRKRQMPFACHIDAGRFEVNTGLTDTGHAFNTVLFTPKGINWVAGEYAKYQIRGQA